MKDRKNSYSPSKYKQWATTVNFGDYGKPSLAGLCGIFLFFLGCSFPFQTAGMVALSSLTVGLFTVLLSYRNRSLIGGFLLGVFTTVTFLLGFFLMIIVFEVSFFFSTGVVGEVPGFSLLIGIVSDYGSGMAAMVMAYAFTGVFFGLLGYVFQHSVPLVITKREIYLFRDYWSNIFRFGKNERQEHPYLDRKLDLRNIPKENLGEALAEKFTEPKPDLVFTPIHLGVEASETIRGNVIDLQSGKRIGSNVVDPFDLASRFRPLVLKVAGLRRTPKGVRSLALERLLSKFLKFFLRAMIFWVFFLSLAALMVLAVYIRDPSDLTRLFSALTVTLVSLAMVWQWRRVSKKLFEKRPDERLLILIVSLILALSFLFFYINIVNPPLDPLNWAGQWNGTIAWMILFSGILGFGYFVIHREAEVLTTYFYGNSEVEAGSSRFTGYRDPKDEPFWIRNENVESYWILRFMYFWKYELATVPHSDWERIEVWIDAQKGTPKWVVSDYHYRELWYKVEGDLPILYTSFFLNFHTPIPITNSKLTASIDSRFNKSTKDLLKTSLSGRADEVIEELKNFFEVFSESWKELHPKDEIINFGLSDKTAGFLSGLPWTYWRYPYGVEEKEKYLREIIVEPEDQPEKWQQNAAKRKISEEKPDK